MNRSVQTIFDLTSPVGVVEVSAVLSCLPSVDELIARFNWELGQPWDTVGPGGAFLFNSWKSSELLPNQELHQSTAKPTVKMDRSREGHLIVNYKLDIIPLSQS